MFNTSNDIVEERLENLNGIDVESQFTGTRTSLLILLVILLDLWT